MARGWRVVDACQRRALRRTPHRHAGGAQCIQAVLAIYVARSPWCAPLGRPPVRDETAASLVAHVPSGRRSATRSRRRRLRDRAGSVRGDRQPGSRPPMRGGDSNSTGLVTPVSTSMLGVRQRTAASMSVSSRSPTTAGGWRATAGSTRRARPIPACPRPRASVPSRPRRARPERRFRAVAPAASAESGRGSPPPTAHLGAPRARLRRAAGR